jgi:hypothetical protein
LEEPLACFGTPLPTKVDDWRRTSAISLSGVENNPVSAVFKTVSALSPEEEFVLDEDAGCPVPRQPAKPTPTTSSRAKSMTFVFMKNTFQVI